MNAAAAAGFWVAAAAAAADKASRLHARRRTPDRDNSPGENGQSNITHGSS